MAEEKAGDQVPALRDLLDENPSIACLRRFPRTQISAYERLHERLRANVFVRTGSVAAGVTLGNAKCRSIFLTSATGHEELAVAEKGSGSLTASWKRGHRRRGSRRQHPEPQDRSPPHGGGGRLVGNAPPSNATARVPSLKHPCVPKPSLDRRPATSLGDRDGAAVFFTTVRRNLRKSRTRDLVRAAASAILELDATHVNVPGCEDD